MESITLNSAGNYTLSILPENNASADTITLSISGSGVSTQYFGETFEDSSISISYNPQTPAIETADLSRWIRGVYSEFQVEASHHLTFSVTGLPDWLEFNSTTGLLSGIPLDGKFH